MSNMGKKDRSDGLDRALDHMCRKTRDLRRQLRKAVVDHVSDSFLETNVPLLVLIEAAKSGNEKEVEEYSQVTLIVYNLLLIKYFIINNILLLFKGICRACQQIGRSGKLSLLHVRQRRWSQNGPLRCIAN